MQIEYTEVNDLAELRDTVLHLSNKHELVNRINELEAEVVGLESELEAANKVIDSQCNQIRYYERLDHDPEL